MQTTGTYYAALGWLSEGFELLPIQPGSKRIVAGYGPNLQALANGQGLDYWFRERACNLAVIAPRGVVILDFDEPGIYAKFRADCPIAAEAYTERTPRGGAHVFLRAEDDRDQVRALEPAEGVEVKRFVLVAPSSLGDRAYTPAGGRILTVNVLEALRGYVLPKDTPSAWREPVKPSQGQIGGKNQPPGGLIERVKMAWPISSYLAYFEPALKLHGEGRWLTALCPWHQDRNPSLWIDTHRNRWGCHACGATGDVLDWHAHKMHLLAGEAARQLDRYNVQVGCV